MTRAERAAVKRDIRRRRACTQHHPTKESTMIVNTTRDTQSSEVSANVFLETFAGAKYRVFEQPDGSLRISVEDGGSLVIDPEMTNVITLSTRPF